MPAMDGAAMIARVLEAASPRPDSSSSAHTKNSYAIRFAEHFAAAMAEGLRPRFDTIEATASRNAGSVRGVQQLDLNYSTPQLGLGLGVSLKSVHIREGKGAGRYTHNMKRNEEELRIEAIGYHLRQPYAVMVGVLCLPFDSCDDARTGTSSSSFGSWIRHLRPFGGRERPTDGPDLFERPYVALYQPDGSDLRFFDTRTAPPRNGFPAFEGAIDGSYGVPRRALSYGEFLDAVHHLYLRRNSLKFHWADGDQRPLDPAGIEDG